MALQKKVVTSSSGSSFLDFTDINSVVKVASHDKQLHGLLCRPQSWPPCLCYFPVFLFQLHIVSSLLFELYSVSIGALQLLLWV